MCRLEADSLLLTFCTYEDLIDEIPGDQSSEDADRYVIGEPS